MRQRVVILGAGISGLAAGWFLKKTLGSDIELTILEQSSRVGGWIQTLEHEGFLFEQGPRSCRTKGQGRAVLDLIEELGMQDEVVIPHSQANLRYLYDGSSLKCLPNQAWKVPFNSLTQGWLNAFWRDWNASPSHQQDESIADFFRRHVGKVWTERLIDPMVAGIYAGDIEQLSVKSCFPLFYEWEKARGSLLKASWFYRSSSLASTAWVNNMLRFPLFSFKKGMQMLPNALAQRLNKNLVLNSQVKKIDQKGGVFQIELSQGKILEADHVLSSLPLFALASLLPFEWNASLKQLPYTSVTVVNFGFTKQVLPYQGFGYLVPSSVKTPILGCVWDSSIFPEQNREQTQTRLTFMLGGARHQHLNPLKEQEALECALQGLKEQLHIHQLPEVIQVKEASQAIPQFFVGFSKWQEEIQHKIHLHFPSFYLMGSAWSGVAIQDCIAYARQISHQIASNINKRN